jgi:hypothetical protein
MKKAMIGMVVMCLMLVSSCTVSTDKMLVVPAQQTYAPDAENALIIFMRPSKMGGVIQSSVFDVSSSENMLVGIVSARKKVAYKVGPGEHLFMVIGENADFMRASLDAGKTYYVLVAPRMGVMKARFSLKPVHKDQLGSRDLTSWKESCDYVALTEDALKWAQDNAADIQNKRVSYYERWSQLSEDLKATLMREDGE